MKSLKFIFFSFLLVGLVSCETETGLSEMEVIAGLKEALKVGTENSVNQTSKPDGYFLNNKIKIPFPPEAQAVKTTLEAIPLGIGQTLVDELVRKLNRAAEDAAVKAKPIFIDAITGITIQDGFNILHGSDTAATHYLRQSTFTDLKTAFKPDIEASLNKVGANTAWAEVISKYNLVKPGDPVNTDLSDYATGKALDGLFIIVGDEEKKIRENPAARVTDILEKVFGELD